MRHCAAEGVRGEFGTFGVVAPLYFSRQQLALSIHRKEQKQFQFQPPGSIAKKNAVGTEIATVEVEGIPFPQEITVSKPLSLLANGITDIEIHFLQIKYNAIGVYLEKDNVLAHLECWKGKKAEELVQDDGFFQALVSAPVEKLLRIVVIKEIKGSQYGVQLESSVRDRLVSVDKYEEDEEEALEKVTEFFQSKYFKPDSVITFHFPTTPGIAEISFVTEGKGEAKLTVENKNVAEMIQKWYLGGESAVSPTTPKTVIEVKVGICPCTAHVFELSPPVVPTSNLCIELAK
uniref:Chalcone-flavonone isomerase family protein n=1 Tax=Oryza barthii TaxID=65489 RepID=A0A0D3HHG5_9ORYZ